MFKTLATTLLAVAGLVIWSGESQAAGCCCRCAPACVAPAAPQTAQAPAAGAYQSFSYEPGAAAAPVATAPVMAARPRTRGDRQSDPWKYGDSKASGRYLWNAR